MNSNSDNKDMNRIYNMNTQSLLIKSFVVLDLETTGLPHLENLKTRITEFSIIAAIRNQLIDASKRPDKLPRVLQKLNVCFYPNKLILPETTEITGLSNELLEEYSSFDESFFNILHNFLDRLPQPVCMIAHNGMRFDFPILQSELKRLGKQLPDTVLCADSLTGFRHIMKQGNMNALVPNNISDDLIDLEIKAVKDIFETEDPHNVINEDKLFYPNWDSYDDVLLKTLDAFEACSTPQRVQRLEGNNDKTLCEEKLHEESGNFLNGKGYYKDLQKILESTPKASAQRQYSKEKVELNSEQEIKETVKKTGTRVRKRLFKAQEKDADAKILKRFRLCDIYLHLFDRDPVESHRAENDALNLMQCIVAESPRFLQWVDENAKPLNNVKSLFY